MEIVSELETARETDDFDTVRAACREILKTLVPGDTPPDPGVNRNTTVSEEQRRKAPEKKEFAINIKAIASVLDSLGLRTVTEAITDIRSGKTPPWVEKSKPIALNGTAKPRQRQFLGDVRLGRRYETGDGIRGHRGSRSLVRARGRLRKRGRAGGAAAPRQDAGALIQRLDDILGHLLGVAEEHHRVRL